MFSLAATVNEILHGLDFDGENGASFSDDIKTELEHLFLPSKNFLNILFNSDEVFGLACETSDGRIANLTEDNVKLKRDVEHLNEQLMVYESESTQTDDENINWQIKISELEEKLHQKTAQNLDLIQTNHNLENQILVQKDKVSLDPPDTEISIDRADELLEESPLVLNKENLSWDDLSSELLTLRNQIKWSNIRPENWQNILMRRIIDKFRSAEIETIAQWKETKGIRYHYIRHSEIMDLQLEIFWPQIRELLDFYRPEKYRCPKCEDIKVQDDFSDDVQIDVRLNADLAPTADSPCKQCKWHENVTLIQ